MKYSSYIIYPLIILVLLHLTGCTDNSSVKKIKVTEFPLNSNLTFLQESKDDIFKYAYIDIKLVDDYVVVVDRKSDVVLHFLDKNSLDYSFSKVSSGNGPNEISISGPLQVKGNNLFLLDKGKKQFYQYNINKLNFQDPLLPDKIYNPQIKAINDVKIIEPNSIIVSGWVDDGLIWMLDSVGSKKMVIGDIPTGCPIGYSNIGYFNISHHFRIDLYPNYKRFIVSSIFSDKLRVFNISGKEEINITGPDTIIPTFNLKNNSCSNPGETKLGYLDVEVKEKYVYGLYYGYSQIAMGKTCRIFVFKHSGKPVACFNLDRNIKAFDVDEENGIFYTLQLKPNIVFKYKYDI